MASSVAARRPLGAGWADELRHAGGLRDARGSAAARAIDAMLAGPAADG
jgi:hypothetical protein